MATITVPPPVGTTVPPSARESAPRQRRTRPVLLGCGLLSGVLYFAGDALMSAVYPGYSYLHQTVSELNAVGAPTWGISIALGLAGYLLLTAFGVGIWQSAAGNRRLRVVGGVLIGMGISSLWAVPFASMQPRGAEQPAAHAVSGIVGTLLLLTALGFGATASGGRFHLYSISTIVAMLGRHGLRSRRAGPAYSVGRGQGARQLLQLEPVVHRVRPCAAAPAPSRPW